MAFSDIRPISPADTSDELSVASAGPGEMMIYGRNFSQKFEQKDEKGFAPFWVGTEVRLCL